MRGVKTILVGVFLIITAVAAALLGSAAGGLASAGGVVPPTTPFGAVKGLVIALFITGLVLIVIGVVQVLEDQLNLKRF